MSRLLRRAIPAIAIAAVLLGMGMIGSARAATHTVDISGFAFSPADLNVTVGDTVTWTNLDAVEHTATSASGGFDSGLLAQGESYSVTFTAPGTYAYLCTPHPTMTGRIVVTAAATTPAPGGSIPDVALPAGWNADLVALGVALVLLGALTLAARLRPERR